MKIKQALFYPYRKDNWRRSLLIPTLIMLGSVFIMGIGFAALFIPSMGMNPGSSTISTEVIMTALPVMLVLFAVAMACMLPLYGYYWELVDHWQTHGIDSPAPSWQGRWKEYTVNGLHYILSSALLLIPNLIAVLSLGLLLPFAISPFFLAAREKRVQAVIRYFGSGMSLATQRYAPVMGALLLYILIEVIAVIPVQILSYTLIGGVVLQQALTVTMFNLFTQAFDIHTEDDPIPRDQDSPDPDDNDTIQPEQAPNLAVSETNEAEAPESNPQEGEPKTMVMFQSYSLSSENNPWLQR